MVINADLIETIEARPDTTITLVTRRKFVVADPLDEVVEKVLAYRRSVTLPTGVVAIEGDDSLAHVWETRPVDEREAA